MIVLVNLHFPYFSSHGLTQSGILVLIEKTHNILISMKCPKAPKKRISPLIFSTPSFYFEANWRILVWNKIIYKLPSIPSDNCLTTALWLPDSRLMVAWWLPDDCLTSDNYLMNSMTTAWHCRLSVTTGQWPPDKCLLIWRQLIPIKVEMNKKSTK